MEDRRNASIQEDGSFVNAKHWKKSSKRLTMTHNVRLHNYEIIYSVWAWLLCKTLHRFFFFTILKRKNMLQIPENHTSVISIIKLKGVHTYLLLLFPFWKSEDKPNLSKIVFKCAENSTLRAAILNSVTCKASKCLDR